MKKILVLMNAETTQIPCIDFAAFLAATDHSKLIGVFVLEKQDRKAFHLQKTYKQPYAEDVITGADDEERNNIQLNRQTQLFKDMCDRREISCVVHRDRGIALEKIIVESRFADLVIVDASLSFNKTDSQVPTQFLEHLMRQAECPVVVAPERFADIDEIMFAYNGTQSSVFAIKQFTYLFPEFEDKKITLLEIKTDEHDRYITEVEKLKELLMFHYGDVHYKLMHAGNPKDELFQSIIEKHNTLLVIGAYGNYRLWSRSTADMILKTLNLPVFIAHC